MLRALGTFGFFTLDKFRGDSRQNGEAEGDLNRHVFNEGRWHLWKTEVDVLEKQEIKKVEGPRITWD